MTSIFVLVGMLVLGAALVQILGRTSRSTAIEVWSIRAHSAAGSAAERALSELYPLSGTGTGCSGVSASWNIGADTGLEGFSGCSVELGCGAVSSAGQTMYTITSSAVCKSDNCSGTTSDSSGCMRVKRTLRVTALE
ncbi:hypothetical protein NF212_01765 [Parasalinivibrio latis]|uniref:hypothetical protein n=1 Tax=Parasalinivibrio latis TaxID=2952610 RepID=UPI0030E5D4B0